ncbi:MAG: aspartate kinase [Bacteriovoracaceae bacterium]
MLFYERHEKMVRSLVLQKNEGEEFLKTILEKVKLTCANIEKSSNNPQEILKWQDELLSCGELVSSKIFYWGLKNHLKHHKLTIHWVSAPTILKTDDQFGKAVPDLIKTREICRSHISPLLKLSNMIVTQGFIGSTHDGATTTIGREGSDYSAALFAEAVEAKIVKIWTDVPGVFSSDPKLIPNAKMIPQISFAKAHELCIAGAKVLHPDTLLPAIRSNIPVFVGATPRPDLGGTWIGRSMIDPVNNSNIKNPFLGLGVRKRQVLLNISIGNCLVKNELLSNVFHILKTSDFDCDLVTTNDANIIIVVDMSRLEHIENLSLVTDSLIGELNKIAPTTIEKQLALITLVDQGNFSSSKIFAQIIDEVKTLKDFNVRLMFKSLGGHSISLLTFEKDVELITRKLHHLFFEQE